MPIEPHDSELEEFCQEFSHEGVSPDEPFDYQRFHLETTLDFDDYVATKDPDHILSHIIETGQVSLIYDILEHIAHASLESFSGIIMIYADRNPDGTFLIYQDVFNSRSGIADRQSCSVTVQDGNLHIDHP